MKKILILIIFLLIICFSSLTFASEKTIKKDTYLFKIASYKIGKNWTKKHTAYQILFTAITVIDWGQTLHISKRPDRYRETNEILGSHPSRNKVNTLIPLGIVTHTTISFLLPPTYREIWQLIWIGIEIQAVQSNFSIGVKIDF